MREVKAIVITLILLAVFGAIGYLYYQNLQLKTVLQQTSLTNKEVSEHEDLIEKVKKLIVLPESEQPTIATVTDKSKLIHNLFFKNAEVGDKLLVYINAKKAILYRPSINKIVEVGPVSNVTAMPKKTNVKPTLLIYYPPGDQATTTLIKDQLRYKFPQLEILNAVPSVNQYDHNIIVDVKGENKTLASEIASFLKAKIELLPKEEASPEADILLILGQ